MIFSPRIGHFQILGHTIDDAIGEAIDKIARNICIDWSSSGGLGKALEKLAKEGNPETLSIKNFDPIDNPLNFSFSGLKTALSEFIRNEINRKKASDIAATVQSQLFGQLIDRVKRCLAILEHAGISVKQLSVIGGVASNQYFKQLITDEVKDKGIEVIIPAPEICTDNAIMIGLAALSIIRNKITVNYGYNINRPTQEWNLEDLCMSRCIIE